MIRTALRSYALPLWAETARWVAGRIGTDWETQASVGASEGLRLDQAQQSILIFKMVMGAFAGISLIVGGIGGGAHSTFPVSSASMIIFSSQTICQAISCAVRDLGSGL